jgi:hypothetical protein
MVTEYSEVLSGSQPCEDGVSESVSASSGIDKVRDMATHYICTQRESGAVPVQ